MHSNATRIVAALVAVAVIVALFFVFTGGDDDGDSTTASTATTPTTAADGAAQGDNQVKKDAAESISVIKVVGGQPQGGVADLAFSEGEDVRFEVDSDTADEVHVHGYDIGKDVEAGGTVKFDFPADIEGVFEVELENSATQIAELTVTP